MLNQIVKAEGNRPPYTFKKMELEPPYETTVLLRKYDWIRMSEAIKDMELNKMSGKHFWRKYMEV